MKKLVSIASFVFVGLANTAFGQDISQSQVPSLVVNSFQQSFSKASDVEWKMDGENYKVEFETGLMGIDHDAWYDKNGKLIKHKEEISKSELPVKVLTKINSDFSAYKIDGAKKITESNKVTYNVKLESFTEEWKVMLDSEGNVLSKVAD